MSLDSGVPKRTNGVDPIVHEAKKLAAVCEEIIQKRNVTEEDFKIAFTGALHKALSNLDIDHSVKFEKNVVNSQRIDALYPSLVLEYKRPGKLADSREVKKVGEQLGDYLRAVMGEKVHRRIVGVAIDGHYIVFVRLSEHEIVDNQKKTVQLGIDGSVLEVVRDWSTSGRVRVSQSSMEQFLLLFRGLVRKTLAPETLVEDFGLQSDTTIQILQALGNALINSQSRRVETLYVEWRRLFGIIYGEKQPSHQKEITELSKKIGTVKPLKFHQLLFILHTYFALIMKLICTEVLSIQQSTLMRSYISDWATLDDDLMLLKELENLESGGIFSNFGIKNFLEGDFFSWYLHIWSKPIANSIRNIAKKLSNYEPATPRLEPGIVKDLLKKLYQYLVPKSIRHDLGEYYTPDWLAQLTLDEVGYHGDPQIRILDPACGSGTFLVEILQRITNEVLKFPEKYSDRDKLLSQVLMNITGFDINPIAVLAARTNFIIALSSLRPGTRIHEISIPIYLADSVLLPEKYFTAEDASYEEANYQLVTSANEPFIIHPLMADREILSHVMDTLEYIVRHKQPVDMVLEILKKKIDPEIIEATESTIVRLHKQLTKLEAEERNRIWARIIKNSFAPLFVEDYDLIVGNPPWINWEYLSKEYRSATYDLWKHFNLLPKKRGGKKTQFALGRTKRDFSMLFTYSVVDRFLKKTGRLGFVITQTVFKTSGGDVFRKFKLPNGTYLSVQKVHDFVKVKPFEGASNRTALLILDVGEETKYPVEYNIWHRKGKIVPTDANLSDALKQLTSRSYVAEPVSRQPTDVWLTADSQSLPAMKKVIGTSPYSPHAGITTWINGVYFLEIVEKLQTGQLHVRNMGNVGKKKVPIYDAVLEPDLIYVLIRGRDISSWRTSSNQYAIVPHTRKTGWRAISEEQMIINYPKSFEFLSIFKDQLENRPGKKQLRKLHEFYILASIGEHTFMPYKVAWGGISKRINAAVLEPKDDTFLGKKMLMLEHSAMYLEASSFEEAHFICALLNSTPSSAVINCFKGMGAYSDVARNIDIPLFDSGNPIHHELSELSQEAHREANLNNEVVHIEKRIDELARTIWNLTQKDLNVLCNELEG